MSKSYKNIMASNKKILIIGGGFAGVFLTKNLLRKLKKNMQNNIDIELICDHNYFVFQPLLPEVSSGIINPHDAVTPLRVLLPNVKHRLASVIKIDSEHSRVELLQGRHKKLIHVYYDELVLACGQKSNVNLVGFTEHAFMMKNLSDAFLLRNHILKCLELADVTLDSAVRRSASTFVVAGGGFSGVETIGELQDMILKIIKYYPNIFLSEIRFILLQKAKRILTELPESLAQYAHKKLTKRQIDIRVNIGVKRASASCLETDDGMRIDTHTIITTIGSSPVEFVRKSFSLKQGKIPVNNYMQLEQNPHIWALGDVALIPLFNRDENKIYAPATAQFAVGEAKILAHNLLAHLSNQPKKNFNFKPLGLMASLGAYQGVVEIYGIHISGILAWSIWRGIYMTKLPGNITKLRVALNWIMDYFFPRTLVQISSACEESTRYMCFSKGDIMYEIGEIMTHFSLIVSGRVLCKNKDKKRILGAQDFFGVDIKTYESSYDYQISALEDTRILAIPWRQFVDLKRDFRRFDELINSIKENN